MRSVKKIIDRLVILEREREEMRRVGVGESCPEKWTRDQWEDAF